VGEASGFPSRRLDCESSKIHCTRPRRSRDSRAKPVNTVLSNGRLTDMASDRLCKSRSSEPPLLPLIFFIAIGANGQSNLPLLTDHLVNVSQDWGWGARNLANTVPVHSGANSATSAVLPECSFHSTHLGFDTTPTNSECFGQMAGAGGGQISPRFCSPNGADSAGMNVGALPHPYLATVHDPLSSIGADSKTSLDRFHVSN